MWTVSTTTPDGETIMVEVPDTEAGRMFTLFKINHHAWRYFGILCFDDRPGYFPQLELNLCVSTSRIPTTVAAPSA